MSRLVMVTGLDQLQPLERWPRLIAPLAEELADSGLGNLPELDSLRREADEGCGLQTAEVAVNLINFNYGLPLLDRVVEAAGITRGDAVLPVRWRDFKCDDYFRSPLAEKGYWDEAGQYWYVWPVERIYEDTELQFLVIGSAGVDGIDWGYRRGHSGLWGWFPISAEFVALAPTTEALLQGYLSEAITV